MENKIKISVIMPVYKVEKYVGKAIESIQSQTLKDFEFLIVDDGSPDNSGKIIDEYAQKDKRININLLLGVKYVPLRDEFTGLPIHLINKKIKSVLILSGGTDPYNIAGILCETFQKNKELQFLDIHVVSGKFNSNLSQITKISQTNDHIFYLF